jgi:transposase
MKNFIIGIDVSKLTLDVAHFTSEGCVKSNHVAIENNVTGYDDMLTWLKEKKFKRKEVLICMEHTGIYTDQLTKFLEKKKIQYTLQSPLHLSKSLGIVRGKKDDIDSFRLSEYADEKKGRIKVSKRAPENQIRLKQLSSERKQAVYALAKVRQTKTEITVYQKVSSQKRKEKQIVLLKKIIFDIEKEMQSLIESDSELSKNYKLLLSIKGIGPVNAFNTIIFTRNFTLFPDARSYACYVAVAPFPHQSGTSIHKRTSVSKIGNRYLKAELSQAGRSAIIHDPQIRKYFIRKFNGKKGPESNYGQVLNAIKFKLICRMFAVIKRQSPYISLNF